MAICTNITYLTKKGRYNILNTYKQQAIIVVFYRRVAAILLNYNMSTVLSVAKVRAKSPIPTMNR